MNILKVLLLIVVELTAITSVISLECWDCKSSINPGCSDEFVEEPFEKMNCSQNARYNMLRNIYGNRTTQLCRKITEKIGDEVRVIRTCGYLDEPFSEESGKCVKRTGSSGLSIESCHCYTNACNTGVNLIPSQRSFTLLFTSIIILTIYSPFS